MEVRVLLRMSKRKIKVFSLSDKIKIVSAFEGGMSRSEILSEFGLPESTFYKIMKDKDSIKSQCFEGHGNSKRNRPAEFPKVEKCLVEWIKETLNRKITLDGPLLKQKAKEFAAKLGIQNFSASNGWLEGFKKRHDIAFKKAIGRNKFLNQGVCNQWNEDRTSLSERYHPDVSYNADDTSYFSKYLKDKTLVLKREEAHGDKRRPRSNTQVSTPTSQHGGSPQYSDGHPSQSSYMPHSHHQHVPPHSLPPPHMHHGRNPVDLAGNSVEPRGKSSDLGRSSSMSMGHGSKASRSPLGPPSAPVTGASMNMPGEMNQASHSMMADPALPLLQYKLTDFLRANLESLEGLPGAKDLLALQNGIWPATEGNDKKTSTEGQEKIVRTFAEIMMNMARIKSCVRPAMCKPYGKQSEALQKTLVDTIQLVQSLRSILPPPHIAVTSWKDEEHKHR